MRCVACSQESSVLIEWEGDEYCPRCRLELAAREIFRDVGRFESWPSQSGSLSATDAEEDA